MVEIGLIPSLDVAKAQYADYIMNGAKTFKRCLESSMKKRVLLCSFFCIMLSGCQFVGTIYNAGHKITSLVLDDRSLKDDYTDTKINLAIRKNLAQRDIKYFLDIEITVFEGCVLLNGALPQTALIDEVNEIVWKTNGVQKVYNYIRLDTPPKITIVNEDAAISAKIRYDTILMSAAISPF